MTCATGLAATLLLVLSTSTLAAQARYAPGLWRDSRELATVEGGYGRGPAAAPTPPPFWLLGRAGQRGRSNGSVDIGSHPREADYEVGGEPTAELSRASRSATSESLCQAGGQR